MHARTPMQDMEELSQLIQVPFCISVYRSICCLLVQRSCRHEFYGHEDFSEFLRDNCRWLQRLLNNANQKGLAALRSGKKKEPKPKLFGPGIFGWGGGLPLEGVGAKKFGTSFETQ